MTGHFNKLTPAEAERLAMLAEKAAEVIKAVSKIQRHGFESYNPDNPDAGTNRDMLSREMTDFTAVATMMSDAKDVPDVSWAEFKASTARKLRYAHHQPVPPKPYVPGERQAVAEMPKVLR